MEINQLNIEDLEFSIRTRNALKNAEILTIEQLCSLTITTLKTRIRGMGQKTIEEIRFKLAEHGLCLAHETVITSIHGLEFIKDLPMTLKHIKAQLEEMSSEIRSLTYRLDQIISEEK
jgi:hypothetical protein